MFASCSLGERKEKQNSAAVLWISGFLKDTANRESARNDLFTPCIGRLKEQGAIVTQSVRRSRKENGCLAGCLRRGVRKCCNCKQSLLLITDMQGTKEEGQHREQMCSLNHF